MNKQRLFDKQPVSYWIASTSETDYPKLDKDLHVDVAVIGGGIAGITTAYLLTLEGLRVAVIEADRVLRATTGHTTAKLTSQHSLIYDKLINQFERILQNNMQMPTNLQSIGYRKFQENKILTVIFTNRTPAFLHKKRRTKPRLRRK